MARRLLFITYYFPPSGGPGVQRALKFVKYLPEFGWEPVVLTVTPEDAAYPNLDPRMAEEVPPALHVEGTKAWDPYALYARLQGKTKHETVGVGFVGEAEATWKQRLARWVRANLFLPDARVGWVPYAVRRGRALLAAGRYDAILTTGPPHSAHLAGLLLGGGTRLPWLADLRDPWTGIDYYAMLPMTPLARRIDAALERRVLERASAVTVVSPSMVHGLARRHARPYEVLQNGFDPADFAGAPAAAPAAEGPGAEFVLSYVGNLNEARNPEALWEALARLEAPERLPRLRVALIGNIDPVVVESARAHGVADLVRVEPYVPHREAVDRMRQSTLLLLLINRVEGAEGIMTGKLYEYLASGRPVLGIGPAGGDAAEVLARTGAGRMFAYGDAAGVADLLQRHYDAWAAGRPEGGAPPAAVEPYSRRSQTGRLAGLLDTLLQP